jgi:hypothetical protein
MTNHVSQLIRLVEGGFGKPHVLGIVTFDDLVPHLADPGKAVAP